MVSPAGRAADPQRQSGRPERRDRRVSGGYGCRRAARDRRGGRGVSGLAQVARLGGQTLPSEIADTFTYTVRQPLGVVGLITPWNFPWAIPCWKMAPALIAGNTVVFKPAALTPGCAALLLEILAEAGLPPGVVN